MPFLLSRAYVERPHLVIYYPVTNLHLLTRDKKRPIFNPPIRKRNYPYIQRRPSLHPTPPDPHRHPSTPLPRDQPNCFVLAMLYAFWRWYRTFPTASTEDPANGWTPWNQIILLDSVTCVRESMINPNQEINRSFFPRWHWSKNVQKVPSLLHVLSLILRNADTINSNCFYWVNFVIIEGMQP